MPGRREERGQVPTCGPVLFSADLSGACVWEGPEEDSCYHISSTVQPQGQLPMSEPYSDSGPAAE